MTTLFDKVVKTRVPHKCWGCRKDIPTGTMARRLAEAVDNQLVTSHWCDTCCEIIGHLEPGDRRDGFAFGDIIDNCKEEYEKRSL